MISGVEAHSSELARLFQAVHDRLSDQRQALNLADSVNGNHGDHMVEIFQAAVQAAQREETDELAATMEQASLALKQLPDNATASLYSLGLEQFANQFRQHAITTADLLAYGQHLLKAENEVESHLISDRSGEVLKALVAGLTGWSQSEGEQEGKTNMLNLGALFELGMAYLQAKQRGGSKTEILADAAASASPLGAVPHRYQSGKMAIQALLEAMQAVE